MVEIGQPDSVPVGSELQATFIVRLRRERGTPAGEWRGEVEHVQSGAQARFRRPGGLCAFLFERLAELELQPPQPQER